MQEIIQAWMRVGEDYRKGRINSERCLQAVFFRELCREFPDASTRIFVEPAMALEGNKFPDLVICGASEILAIIELKFVPHGYSQYKDDLKKLVAFARKQGTSFEIALDAETGKLSEDRFAITARTRYVFAVVCQSDAEAVSQDDVMTKIPAELHDRFLHLRGIVGKDLQFDVSS